MIRTGYPSVDLVHGFLRVMLAAKSLEVTQVVSCAASAEGGDVVYLSASFSAEAMFANRVAGKHRKPQLLPCSCVVELLGLSAVVLIGCGVGAAVAPAVFLG